MSHPAWGGMGVLVALLSIFLTSPSNRTQIEIPPEKIRIATFKDMEEINKIPVYPYGVHGVSLNFNDNKQLIAYGKSSGTASDSIDANAFVVYDLRSNSIIKIFKENNWDFTISFYNNYKNIAYSCNGILHILDRNFNEISKIDTGGYISEFIISRKETVLVVHSLESNTIRSYELKNNLKLISSYELLDKIDTQNTNLDISRSENLVAISGGYEKNFVYIYSIHKGFVKKLTTSSKSGSYSPLFYNNDQNILVGSGYGSGVIDLIEIESGIINKTINAFENYVYKLKLSSDDRFLFTGGYDQIIKVYDTWSWLPLKTYDLSHSGVINDIVLDEKQSILVTGSNASGSKTNGLIVWKVIYK